jgi:hypothetical protein
MGNPWLRLWLSIERTARADYFASILVDVIKTPLNLKCFRVSGCHSGSGNGSDVSSFGSEASSFVKIKRIAGITRRATIKL